MANTIIRVSVQINEEFETPKRMIVQYNNGTEDTQTINNYEDLTTEEKATFDAYQAICESKMV